MTPPARHWPRCRRAASAVEFGIVGAVFVTLVLLAMETCWQMAVGAALDYGARAASRFGITGAAAPPGMTPPPPTRADAIVELVLQSTGGLLQAAQLSMSEASYAGFGGVGTPGQGAAGAGTPGQVVQYTLSYTQPFLTPLAAALTGLPAIVHTASVTVLNEPFPASP